MPLVVITFCYVNIYRHYKRSRATLLAHKKPRHHHHRHSSRRRQCGAGVGHTYYTTCRRQSLLLKAVQNQQQQQLISDKDEYPIVRAASTNLSLSELADVQPSPAGIAIEGGVERKNTIRKYNLHSANGMQNSDGLLHSINDQSKTNANSALQPLMATTNSGEITNNIGETIIVNGGGIIGGGNAVTPNNRSKNSKEEAERKLLFSLVLVLAAFIICW